jgi:hypothetical protein
MIDGSGSVSTLFREGDPAALKGVLAQPAPARSEST